MSRRPLSIGIHSNTARKFWEILNIYIYIFFFFGGGHIFLLSWKLKSYADRYFVGGGGGGGGKGSSKTRPHIKKNCVRDCFQTRIANQSILVKKHCLIIAKLISWPWEGAIFTITEYCKIAYVSIICSFEPNSWPHTAIKLCNTFNQWLVPKSTYE